MTTTVAARSTVRRPLAVLVPMIHQNLQKARDAAAEAGLPYFRATGELLIEAKAQLEHGEWRPWLKRHFHLSLDTALDYMKLAHKTAHLEKGSRLPFSTLSEAVRPNRGTHQPTWHAPVRDVVDRVDTETLNLKREELKRDEERQAQRKLALQLIDIGYKVLAKTLHPDKGGSRAAMARLNAVRDRLKQCI